MKKLIVFNHITLDGYFAGANGDFSWAHTGNDDAEYQRFVTGNASGGDSRFLFGRVTYQLMAGYWPTPIATEHDPVVAMKMNSTPKVVFSNTLEEATWANTTLIRGDLIGEVRRLKDEAGPDLVIFGSGSIVAQLAPSGLIDEYQMVLDPVVLGKGKTMFSGITGAINLRLTKSRVFNNGKVFLCYSR